MSRPSSQRQRKSTVVEIKPSTLCAGLSEQAEAAFIHGIPAEYIRLLEKPLLRRYGLILYGLIFAVASGIFAYLFVTSLSKLYLSPEPQSNCVSVDRPVTGSFFGDMSGHWSGTEAFDPSRSPFQFVLQNFSLASSLQALPNTGDDLKGGNKVHNLQQLFCWMMTSVSASLEQVVAPIMMRSNVATNLLYLMMWSIKAPTGDAGNEQVFSFSGDPQSVFEALPYQQAGLGTGNGLCHVLPQTLFNSAAQRWVISWPSSEFMADKNCVAALPPSTLGRVEGDPAIDISIDIRSFFAAVAANIPPPPVSELAESDGPTLSTYNSQLKEVYWASEKNHIVTLGHGHENYYIGQYWDPRYPGAEAMYCITLLSSLEAYSSGQGPPPRKQCFVNAGGALFAIPLFDSYGAKNNIFTNKTSLSPEPCRCNMEDGGPLNSHEKPTNCHEFDFLSSLVFFPADMIEVSTKKGTFKGMMSFLTEREKENKSDEPGSSLAEQAFNASYFTAPHLTGIDGTYTSFVYTMSAGESATARREAFSFCETPYGNCSILTIRSTSSLALFSRSYKASPGYFSFDDGFCNFTLLQPGAFESLVKTPPVSLEQDYYRCVPLVTDTFALTFGVSVSNTLALAPMLAMGLVSAMLFSQWFTGRYLPRAFSAAEKEEVLGLLATRILLRRRGQQQLVLPASVGADKIPLHSGPTISVLAAELEDDGTDTASGDDSPSSQIFICEPPNPNAPAEVLAATFARRCRRIGKAPDGKDSSSFQVDSPLPAGAPRRAVPLSLSVDTPSERL